MAKMTLWCLAILCLLSFAGALSCNKHSDCPDTQICRTSSTNILGQIFNPGTCEVPPSCTTDAECQSPGYYYCAGGQCASATSCSTNTDCDSNKYKGAVCVANAFGLNLLGVSSYCLVGPQCSVLNAASCPFGVCHATTITNSLLVPSLGGVCADKQTCAHNSECGSVGSCTENSNEPPTCQVPPTCATDQECANLGNFYYCVSGRCVPYSKCTTDADCKSNYYEGGVCVPGPSNKGPDSYCLAGSKCKTNNPASCTDGTCHAISLTGDVTDGTCISSANSKACTKNSDCKTAEVCVINHCEVPPTCNTDAECAALSGYFYCANGRCASTTDCSTNGDCDSNYYSGALCVVETASSNFHSAPRYCIAGPRCTSSNAATCSGGVCHVTTLSTTPQDGTCLAPTFVCTKQSDCTGGKVCVNGHCEAPPPCTTDAECAAKNGYYYCYEGRCASTTGCTANGDCVSDSYPNGVCIPGPSRLGNAAYCLAGPQCATGNAAVTCPGKVCHFTSLAPNGAANDGTCLAPTGNACTLNSNCGDGEVCAINHCEVPPTCTTDAQCRAQNGYFYCVQGHCASTTSCSINEECDSNYYINAVCVAGPGSSTIVQFIGNSHYCIAGPQCSTAAPANCTAIGGVCTATSLSTTGNNGACLVANARPGVPTFMNFFKKNPKKGLIKGHKKKVKLVSPNKIKSAKARFNGTSFTFAPSSRLVQIDTWVPGGKIVVRPFPKDVQMYLYILAMPSGKFTFSRFFTIVSKCPRCGRIKARGKSLTIPKGLTFSGILKFSKGVKAIGWKGRAKNKKNLVKFVFATVAFPK